MRGFAAGEGQVVSLVAIFLAAAMLVVPAFSLEGADVAGAVVPEGGAQASVPPVLRSDGHALARKGLLEIMTSVGETEFLEDVETGEDDSDAAMNHVLAKAQAAAAKANQLIAGGDDPSVQAAKQKVQDLKKKAERHEQEKMVQIHAIKANAQTEAAGELANATAEANHLMMQAQSQELKGKQVTQQKADELSHTMAAKASDNEKKSAKILLLAKKVAKRLAKAEALEKQASEEKEGAEKAELRAQKVFEVNKEFLLKQKAEAQAALQQALALSQAAPPPGLQ